MGVFRGAGGEVKGELREHRRRSGRIKRVVVREGGSGYEQTERRMGERKHRRKRSLANGRLQSQTRPEVACE